MGRNTPDYDRCGGSKVQKDGGNENRDFISELPDCLLSHILSCLPARDAVRTCVLSKFWENKWKSIYNVCINGGRNLAKCMDEILLNVQHIRSVDLGVYNMYDAGRINTWVSTIFSRNVESFAIFSRVDHDPGGIILFCSLLKCASLRILKLQMHCTLKVSVKTCFLKLTSLNLKNVWILDDNRNTDTLKFDFPVLETLVLNNCQWVNMSSVEFCAPALHSLELSSYHLDEDCIIKILGERLAEFRSLGYHLGNFLLVGSSVVRAELDNAGFTESDEEEEVAFEEGLKIRRLLNELSNLEELKLQTFVVMAIALTKSELPLPKYDKLRRLAISGGSGCYHVCDTVGALFELLHAAPSLKLLDIDMIQFSEHADDFDYEAMVPLAVPFCIVSQLEEVHLRNFCGEARELHLAVFLLTYGAKLKKLTISRHEGYCSKMGKDELEQVLSGLPKASASIAVVVCSSNY